MSLLLTRCMSCKLKGNLSKHMSSFLAINSIMRRTKMPQFQVSPGCCWGISLAKHISTFFQSAISSTSPAEHWSMLRNLLRMSFT